MAITATLIGALGGTGMETAAVEGQVTGTNWSTIGAVEVPEGTHLVATIINTSSGPSGGSEIRFGTHILNPPAGTGTVSAAFMQAGPATLPVEIRHSGYGRTLYINGTVYTIPMEV